MHVLRRLEKDWATPRAARHGGETTSFRLSCTLGSAPEAGDPGGPVPEELAEFWRHAGAARLFEDQAYGQWGLVLLPPERARELTKKFREERARDYLAGDLVLGEFLGDSDLLLLRCDAEADDFGQVLVVLPLDPREDWYRAADDLESFLEAYERAEGAKYWEVG